MTQIAFIGLGHMGLPMARNLLKAGFAVSVFDLVQDSVASLAAEGAKAADSAVDAVRDATVVISMLPASRHVEGLYLGDSGLLTISVNLSGKQFSHPSLIWKALRESALTPSSRACRSSGVRGRPTERWASARRCSGSSSSVRENSMA